VIYRYLEISSVPLQFLCKTKWKFS